MVIARCRQKPHAYLDVADGDHIGGRALVKALVQQTETILNALVEPVVERAAVRRGIAGLLAVGEAHLSRMKRATVGESKRGCEASSARAWGTCRLVRPVSYKLHRITS